MEAKEKVLINVGGVMYNEFQLKDFIRTSVKNEYKKSGVYNSVVSKRSTSLKYNNNNFFKDKNKDVEEVVDSVFNKIINKQC